MQNDNQLFSFLNGFVTTFVKFYFNLSFLQSMPGGKIWRNELGINYFAGEFLFFVFHLKMIRKPRSTEIKVDSSRLYDFLLEFCLAWIRLG